MKRGLGRAVVRELERLVDPGTLAGLTEAQILARFVERRDPVAFEAIVSRHGPMVLSVCRQMLRDVNDVDDAFQATFVILITKARGLRQPERLGPWLHGVAIRVAVRARKRHRSRELTEDVVAPRRGDFVEDREWVEALHEEIQHLPEKYRLPVVLCCLEGLPHDEAARQLGWPVGTIHGRLSRARDLLRERLGRRGVALSTPISEALLLVKAGGNVLPEAVRRGAVALLTGQVPTHLEILIKGVLFAMFIEKWKLTGLSLAVALAGVASASTALLAYQAAATERGPAKAASPSAKIAPAHAGDSDARTADGATARDAVFLSNESARPESDEAGDNRERLAVDAELLEHQVQFLHQRMINRVNRVNTLDEVLSPDYQPGDREQHAKNLGDLRDQRVVSERERDKAIEEYKKARIELSRLRRRLAAESKSARVLFHQSKSDGGPLHADQSVNELIQRLDRLEGKIDRLLDGSARKATR